MMLSTIPDTFKPLTPRKKRGKQPEGMVVNVCLKWLWAHGVFCWVNKTGALKDKNGRTIRYGHVGSSDLIGLTRSGRFIGVECKSATGRHEPPQKLFRDRIQEKGGIYILARSTDDLEKRKQEIMA